MGTITNQHAAQGVIRPCRPADQPVILGIINAAAEAYRGVIPADCWHDPYMPETTLAAEIAAGVAFSGFETAEGLVGVMGLQHKDGVALIRHAYVVPGCQNSGVGTALLAALGRDARPLLVGTWRAAGWAIRFYERQGFRPVPEDEVAPLLRRYWTVPERQIETSIVLSRSGSTELSDRAAL